LLALVQNEMSHVEGRPLLGLETGAVQSDLQVPGISSALGSVLNLTNTIVGAGLLSIPFAFRVAGLVPGLLMLLFMWMIRLALFVTCWAKQLTFVLRSSLSFDVLARSAHYTGVGTTISCILSFLH
jgi:amino acid permease